MEDGRVVAEATGPGANVAALSPDLVEQRICELLRTIGSPSPAACCAGAAGAEVPGSRDRLAGLLTRLLPGSRISVVHDARLVLAATGLDEGIAIVAGTGSVAYGRAADGREARRGGWGWMLGDEGSAVWITREAAREVMRRSDDGEPPGAMGEALLEACGARDSLELTQRLHGMHEPREWASRARAVFAAASVDGAAASLVHRAGAALSDLARAIGDSLDMGGPVVLAGGLLLNEPSLESAVRDQLDMPCRRLGRRPVEGAVELARESVET